MNADEQPGAGRATSNALTSHYEHLLMDRYGPLIGGAALLKVAGYPNAEALRLAVRRNAVGFPVFAISGRRGRFARASDVARWLANIDQGLPSPIEEEI